MVDDWRGRFVAAFPQLEPMTHGSADAFDVAIRSVALTSGERMPVQRAGVTAMVGANNSGKSTILREIWEKLAHRQGFPAPPTVAVESLELETKGSASDVVAWLGDNASFVVQGTQAGFVRFQMPVEHPQMLVQSWGQGVFELGALANALIFYGNAQGRFGIGGSVEMRESVSDPPQHPVHYLQDSKSLFAKLSGVTNEIFGVPLTLDTLGRTIRIRVGTITDDVPKIDDIPPEYRAKMASLRPLDEQGDGMRSLMGQLLPVATAAYKVVILDEPEAFLHPPQAHALGVELGRLAEEGRLQILLATHDRSLLTGLLDSGADVSVVRLTRDGQSQRVSQLESARLRELWADSVLRYSNILDGLFHRLVVVSEAEGDCAFLAAALDCPGRPPSSIPRNEILFAPTGGKDGMPKVCSALNAVDVPVVAAPDLDALSDPAKLKTLVESVGGEWGEDLQKLWTIATSTLSSATEPARVGHILDAITAALASHRAEPYSSSHREAVTAQLRTSGSPWDTVKDHGLSAFKGDARAAVEELLDKLDDLGVVLVREGELERLAPSVKVRKGPGWLQAALTQAEQCNAATQAHVDCILTSGERRTTRLAMSRGLPWPPPE